MSKNCTPLWREAHFEAKMLKNWGSQTTFWSSDVEKLHATVARNAFWSQHAKKLTVSGPLFEVQMLKNDLLKIAQRCGEKHISKSKCTKYLCFAAFFQVQMSKNWSVEKIAQRCGEKHISKSKCTKYLCFAAFFQVQMSKNWSVEKLHNAVARSTFPSQNVKKLTVSDHFLKLRCWKIARRCGEKHSSKSKC